MRYHYKSCEDRLYTLHVIFYNKVVAINVSHNMKAGDYMPTGMEVIKQAFDDFKKIRNICC